MFSSIYNATVTPVQFLLMAAAALVSGVLFSWLMSFRVRANRRFFLVTSILPFVVGLVITFVNGNIGAGVAFGGAFALVRFRSAQGTAEEIASVLIAMASGVAFGLGYVVLGALSLLGLGVFYLGLSSLTLFDHPSLQRDRMLQIAIPESLEYHGAFDEPFARYLEQVENVGVKTTGMGSMFKLTYRVRLKNPAEEKALIDDLRVRNGNLEISLLPYSEPMAQL